MAIGEEVGPESLVGVACYAVVDNLGNALRGEKLQRFCGSITDVHGLSRRHQRQDLAGDLFVVDARQHNPLDINIRMLGCDEIGDRLQSIVFQRGRLHGDRHHILRDHLDGQTTHHQSGAAGRR